MTVSNVFFISATETFGLASPLCPALVRSAFSELEAQWADPAQRASAAASLGLCDALPLLSPDRSFRLLQLWAENAFATLGMEDYPYPVAPFPAWPMQVACQNALLAANASSSSSSSASPPLAALKAALNVVYNASGDVPCHAILAEYMPCADITGCGAPGPAAFSWDYQSCTQIVSDVDTGPGDMFPDSPWNFTALQEYCWRRWRAVPDPLGLLQAYPLRSASNIIWSNGSYDPWMGGGVLSPPSASQYVFVIAQGAHHLDLRGSDPQDPPSVVAVRQQEWLIIQKWIQSSS